MKIIADENMPLVKELFGNQGELIVKNGRSINAEDLKDADILLIRSITKVNKELLEKAEKLKFIGTATAGFDHVDVELLKNKGIAFSNAQGCNRISVGEYVLSALLFLEHKYGLDLSRMSLGVIGAGCTGSEVIKRARALGMNVVVSDPPLKQKDPIKYADYVSFDEVIKCDIVTFHVPLTREGDYKTYNLVDVNVLKDFYTGKRFLINASRGEVVDDFALNEALSKNLDFHAIKDVWCGEPNINCRELILKSDIATPHIAGYAYEGKCRGTYMLYEKLCEFTNKAKLDFQGFLKKPDISEITINSKHLDHELIRHLVNLVYDVKRDDDLFRLGFHDGASFDMLRKKYPERRELSSLTVNAPNLSETDTEILQNLGFTVA